MRKRMCSIQRDLATLHWDSEPRDVSERFCVGIQREGGACVSRQVSRPLFDVSNFRECKFLSRPLLASISSPVSSNSSLACSMLFIERRSSFETEEKFPCAAKNVSYPRSAILPNRQGRVGAASVRSRALQQCKFHLSAFSSLPFINSEQIETEPPRFFGHIGFGAALFDKVKR